MLFFLYSGLSILMHHRLVVMRFAHNVHVRVKQKQKYNRCGVYKTCGYEQGLKPKLSGHHSSQESPYSHGYRQPADREHAPLETFGIFVDMMREDGVISGKYHRISHTDDNLQKRKTAHRMNKKKAKKIYSHKRGAKKYHIIIILLPGARIQPFGKRKLDDRFRNCGKRKQEPHCGKSRPSNVFCHEYRKERHIQASSNIHSEKKKEQSLNGLVYKPDSECIHMGKYTTRGKNIYFNDKANFSRAISKSNWPRWAL